ncbi:MAG: hypothetical protein CVU81_02560 [Euryarchaeota archaeon HGW-Euryarchaeota-1]|nr:MAG: hypothetical protein CVU81_02560 [Euryarchaeota archaeon HGW-Euryarchaeota-1]
MNEYDIVTLFSAQMEKLDGIEGVKPILRQIQKFSGVYEWLTQGNARLTQELSDKEKEIILFALKNERITSKECQKLLQISRVMANRYFTKLIEKNLITRKGAGKFTYYLLSNEQSNDKSDDKGNDKKYGEKP